jgi:DNA-binding MarR family transcriptional regulator
MLHHAFDGLTTKQAASKLGLTPACVTHHMRQMKKIAPQLFPILTKKQADVYYLYVHAGNAISDIAKALGITTYIVKNRIYEMRRKGMFIPWMQGKRMRYQPWMDSEVKLKF